jgi:hypothetical protein
VTVEQRQAARLANTLPLVSDIQRQIALTSFTANVVLKEPQPNTERREN